MEVFGEVTQIRCSVHPKRSERHSWKDLVRRSTCEIETFSPRKNEKNHGKKELISRNELSFPWIKVYKTSFQGNEISCLQTKNPWKFGHPESDQKPTTRIRGPPAIPFEQSAPNRISSLLETQTARFLSWLAGIWVFPKIMGKPPKSSILVGVSIINHPFWGTPIFGNTHIPLQKFYIDTRNSWNFVENWLFLVSFWYL